MLFPTDLLQARLTLRMLPVLLFREELRMWIEELIWLWGPTVCAIGGWMGWRLSMLTTEIRSLRQRIEELERRETVRTHPLREVA